MPPAKRRGAPSVDGDRTPIPTQFRSLAGFDRTGKDSLDADKAPRRMWRTGAVGVPSTSSPTSVGIASSRPQDPYWYWRQNNLPYDVFQDDEALNRARDFCRLLYLTHPFLPSCIDIFAEYPLSDMHLECKDQKLVGFYEDLFFDQLNYKDFLADIGHEHWTVGEAFPIGSFNETLGVWEDDRLVQSNDVEVHESMFFREPWFEMRLPDNIREVLITGEPRWEYEQILRAYPEFRSFTTYDDQLMTVSSVVMKQIKFNADPFHPRGIPILMRAFRAVWQEEMMSAAMDAIASRLYTPLIVAKLGASATDLGTEYPWIPNDGDLQNFEMALDAALAADFRVIIHHFGLQMETVFGRENMPDLSADFERLQDRMMQVFGLSRSVLAGADQGETYAGDALNLNLVGQRLGRYQRKLKKFFRQRAEVVAEARGHFDYEVRGGKRYPIMESYVDYEADGTPVIKKQPKLLVPTLEFKEMNMVDEQTMLGFLTQMKELGVPISDKRLTRNITSFDYDEEIETVKEEQVAKAVAAQEARKETYEAERSKRLPIQDDLRADFDPKATAIVPPAIQPQPLESLTTQTPGESYTLQPPPGTTTEGPEEMPPVEDDTSMADPSMSQDPGNGSAPVDDGDNPFPARPPESDQMRASMPKPTASFDRETQAGARASRAARGVVVFGKLPPTVGSRRSYEWDPDAPLDEQMEGRYVVGALPEGDVEENLPFIVAGARDDDPDDEVEPEEPEVPSYVEPFELDGEDGGATAS